MDIPDFDKTPSNEAESNNGSDDDDPNKKKFRPFDDLFDDDSNETDLHNIWRKRRRVHGTQQSTTTMPTEPNNSSGKQANNTTAPTYKHADVYPKGNCLYMRPHDHQVPALVPVQHGDGVLMVNRFVSSLSEFSSLAFPSLQWFLQSEPAGESHGAEAKFRR